MKFFSALFTLASLTVATFAAPAAPTPNLLGDAKIVYSAVIELNTNIKTLPTDRISVDQFRTLLQLSLFLDKAIVRAEAGVAGVAPLHHTLSEADGRDLFQALGKIQDPVREALALLAARKSAFFPGILKVVQADLVKLQEDADKYLGSLIRICPADLVHQALSLQLKLREAFGVTIRIFRG